MQSWRRLHDNIEQCGTVVTVTAADCWSACSNCRKILAAGKPLYTFDHSANTDLIQAGAQVIKPGTELGSGMIHRKKRKAGELLPAQSRRVSRRQ